MGSHASQQTLDRQECLSYWDLLWIKGAPNSLTQGLVL